MKTDRQKAGAKKSAKPRATRATRATRQEDKPADEHGKAAKEPLLKPFSFTGWGYEMPSLGVAEKRAQLHDESAAFFEKREREELAKEEREQAAWWRKLADYPEAKAEPHYDDCQSEAMRAIHTLLARGEKFDGALLPLFKLLIQLHSGLHALAANGKKWAARLLVKSLGEAVTDFEKLATAKPELFDFVREGFGVPAIISPSLEKTADNQRLVKQLRVGEDYQFDIMPTGKGGKKWKFQERANALAVRLIHHIQDARGLYGFHKAQAAHAGRELPGWLHDAMKLEPFSPKPKTRKAWADIAWQVLAEISPNNRPEEHPAFYDAATKICTARESRKEYDYSKSAKCDAPLKVRKCASIAKEDIREALFGAFETIAGGVSPRTKQRKAKAKAFPDNASKDR